MTPLLQPGETILVKRTKKYFPQDVVISEHPFRSDIKIVKKIEAIEANGRVKLIGVNPIESQHHFGLIQPRKIIGKVTSKLDGKTSDR